jgi:protein MpaA
MFDSTFRTSIAVALLVSVASGFALAPLPARADAVAKFVLETQTPAAEQRKQLAKWCEETRKSITQFDWKVDPCVGPKGDIQWRIGGTSVKGRPLLFAEFGNISAPNTTLILSTVHGDEITPLYLGVQMAHWLQEHKEEYANAHVVIAPMVNPDGFFHSPRTRTNANGVDVNRNFATSDWSGTALKSWKAKYRSDPRRFPGPAPRSEPETLFQEELIQKVRPQKILAVHSPLNHLDYDGPSALTLSKFPNEYISECLKLRKRLKAVSTGFFPGSLGNYAGKELGIPTVTLELPSADHRKAGLYWNQFIKGIRTMIEFTMPDYAYAGM